MKTRLLYGISTRQASSFSVFGRFWWKGLRYVYFRKILTSGFRPTVRLTNASPKKRDRLESSKLPTHSSTPIHQQVHQQHQHQLQYQQPKESHHFPLQRTITPQHPLMLRTTMKLRDIARLVLRTASVAARRRRLPTATPALPSSFSEKTEEPFHQQSMNEHLQQMKSDSLLRAEEKDDGKSKFNSSGSLDIQSENAVSNEKVQGIDDQKTKVGEAEKLNTISESVSSVVNRIPPVVPMPSGKETDARMTEGMIVYARRLPQLLTGMVTSLRWSQSATVRDEKIDPRFRAVAQKALGIDESIEKVLKSSDSTAKAGLDLKHESDSAISELEEIVAREEKEAAPVKPQSAPSWKRQTASWTSHEAATSRTRYLMRAVATANTTTSQMTRLQDFCKHLIDNPQAKNLAVKERAIPLMLRLRTITRNPEMSGYINEALALLGYIAPLPKQGIRILTIDGGGTRGVMALEILRQFEQITCQPVHKLFDFMCGVSTGAILSVLLGALKASMDECEELYKKTSTEIFNQSTWLGTGKLVLSHAFYDTDAWVKVLQKNIGEIPLIHTARDRDCPKIATVSTIVNEPRLRAFLFRNYEYPHRHQSEFPGSNSPQLWEAIRASAAAPGYFEEYKLGDYIHQDGGILTNNPSALAIHECRHLWPNKPIQCVISLGNGRYEPQVPASTSASSLKTKLLKIVDSATDTEGVHMILNDLLPPKRYYRFNPYLSSSFSLDEIRPEKFKQLQNDARMYIRKNEHKIREAAVQLLEPKSKTQFIKDAIKEKVMTYM